MTILIPFTFLQRYFSCSLASITYETNKITHGVSPLMVSTQTFYDMNLRYLDPQNALQHVYIVVGLQRENGHPRYRGGGGGGYI